MQQLLEFVGNNLIWVSLWFALLIFMIWNQFGHLIQGVIQIEPMEATRLINHEHAVVIDIRKPEEFANGHVINALNIGIEELAGKKTEIEKMKKKPIIVYCQNGTLAPGFVKRLKAEAPAVFCLKGGIASWQRAALPLSRSNSPVTAS